MWVASWSTSPTGRPEGSGIAAVGDGDPFADGTILGTGFQIRNTLASGGMGVVYLATHAGRPGWFAIKAPRRDAVHLPGTVEALRQEAEILGRVNHPNVVRGFEFALEPDGIPYLVMEYLPGRDVAEILRAGVMAPRRTAAIIDAVAAGLAAAHAHGIVHCDLKPSNIVIVPGNGARDRGAVKVVDFGISQSPMQQGILDETGVAGTPDYMAPERARGSFDEVGPKSDQFSLAVTAFEMLTGRLPFPGSNAHAVMQRIVHDPPVRLGSVSDALGFAPHATEAVISRALDKEPAERFPTVVVFARALEAALRMDTADFVLGPPPRARVQARLASRPSVKATVDDRPAEHGPAGSAAASARRKVGARGFAKAAGVAAALALLLGSLFAVARDGSGGHTETKGASSSAAEPGISQPRSGESGSAQPLPP